MKNAEIAAAFDELGTLYELDGAVVYRVLAYRNAAKAIRDSGVSVAELARQGRAESLPGIGKTIAEKIDALLAEGEIPAAGKLKARIPVGLVEVTRIPGLGPKRARQLHDELGVDSIESLRAAAEGQQIRTVAGFGARAEEKILAALAAGADGSERERVLLSVAREVGGELVEGLRASGLAERVELAGSARRWTDTCKDLDVVVAVRAAAGGVPGAEGDATDAGREPGGDGEAADADGAPAGGQEPAAPRADPAAVAALIDAFAALPAVDDVTTRGEAGAKATTHQGLAVDLRVVAADCFGNLLQHFTGSGRHNEALRTAAVRRGLHVSEYGILDDATGETVRCADEAAVYARLGMAYVESELREDRGELEAAREGTLPELVTVADIRGDLHCHTTASDGHDTVLEMARAAQARGYEYLAITDHSASHGFGNHVDADELLRQIERVARANEKLDGFTVLSGSEVNILPDGSLDYSDELLDQLDWVIASAHTSFGMSEDEMTRRIVTAIEHPAVRAIGHPTGRMLGRREPYAVDMDRVIEAAARTGTFLEINANPNRRDLDDVYAREAARAGVKLVIDSDAHRAERLGVIEYGVATARRAWLTAGDVANTRAWTELARGD
ncbi:MAG: PHP domain-containing protein [Solirubrobacterales bacterium]|nr:PHP domain-containing protein [Solirubrobacterales bacterium]